MYYNAGESRVLSRTDIIPLVLGSCQVAVAWGRLCSDSDAPSCSSRIQNANFDVLTQPSKNLDQAVGREAESVAAHTRTNLGLIGPHDFCCAALRQVPLLDDSAGGNHEICLEEQFLSVG